MLGCTADRVVDAVEVILRVALQLGLPNHLARKYFFAVDHGCDFAITAARVETNAAALQVPAHSRALLFLLGQLRERDLFDDEAGLLVDLGEELGVERARAAGCILTL